MLNINTAEEDIFYDSTLPELSDFNIFKFVSDVTVLKPNLFHKRFYEEVDLISKYDKKNRPLLPNQTDMLCIIHYRGLFTEGTMNVIGFGHCAQWFNNSDVNGLLYERFYVANPDTSLSKIDDEPNTGSVSDDSSAYCYKTGDDKNQNDRVHLFLVGALNNYRILTPAHFALEQIRIIIKNNTLKFLRCSKQTMAEELTIHKV